MIDNIDADILFKSNIITLATSLEQILQEALVCYELLTHEHNLGIKMSTDASKGKGKLSSVYISFLLSSVLCKLPWLRIDLYDENGLTDTLDCSSDWDASCISESLYCYADLIASKQFEDTRVHMLDYEREQIWLNLSDEYFNRFEKYMPHILAQCEITRKVNCNWYYGQLFGQATLVWKPEHMEATQNEIL